MDRGMNELTWNYDEDADVLYLSFGEPTPAYGDHLDEDIVLRYSLADESVVGMTILGFREMGGIDALLERLEGFVSGLRIPEIAARAGELREKASAETVGG